jgi:excisionase family DNA binding protein
MADAIATQPESPWMTRQGVAEHLSIDLNTVDRWCSAGVLTRHSIGRVIRFRRDEVDAAMTGAR